MKTAAYLRTGFLIIAAGASALLLFSFLDASQHQKFTKEPTEAFKKYWYNGKAELTSYKLTQARYGELREGTAVLMFVKIDADKTRLTKLGQGQTSGIPTLQMNFEKKFVTGIYPYSMELSVLTPIDADQDPRTLKAGASCQEWCGHTYTQLNLNGNHYEMTRHSYFPDEADEKYSLGSELLEDEIWTRIRTAPDQLPVGKFKMIQGLFYSRLAHNKPAIFEVEATHGDCPGNPKLKEYKVTFPTFNRTLIIRYEKEFPYVIDNWEETYTDGFGEKAKQLTTKGEKMKTIVVDYWSKNSVADSTWRKELGLQ